MSTRDWLSEIRERCEDIKRGKGGATHVVMHDVPRLLALAEAADELAQAGRAYYTGMDACHRFGMSEVEDPGDPPECKCDANAAGFDAALAAYREKRAEGGK